MPETPPYKIAVIGLGYVGLPLASLLAQKYSVTGFDINPERVAHICAGQDPNLEVESEELQSVLKIKNNSEIGLFCSANDGDIKGHDFYIVCVPTPVDFQNEPDFSLLTSAAETVGRQMESGSIVVFESTVYPGATEEICMPILEKQSGLNYQKDFFLGYSPERINPGDSSRKLKDIQKITSGSTPEAAQKIDALYRSIITAGTYAAPSMAVAEAAKVIENAQRDLNIAFVNELAMIFSKMGLDTQQVLQAAATKWNFLPFSPGLVGGHCIGVDPYYLAHKAKSVGHHPEVILAGRKLNSEMGAFVASQVLHLMGLKKITMDQAPVLLVGFSFKENCPDVRNTGVMSVYKSLAAYGASISIYDPVADARAAKAHYGLSFIQEPKLSGYQAVLLCVAHRELKDIDWNAYTSPNGLVYKVKSNFRCAAAASL